jgi:hypothetical protein
LNQLIGNYQNFRVLEVRHVFDTMRNLVEEEKRSNEIFKLIIFIPCVRDYPLKFSLRSNSRSYHSTHNFILMEKMLLSDKSMIVIHEIPRIEQHNDLTNFYKLDEDILAGYIDDFKKLWLRYVGIMNIDWINEKILLKEEYHKNLLLNYIIQRNLNYTETCYKLLLDLDKLSYFKPSRELLNHVRDSL